MTPSTDQVPPRTPLGCFKTCEVMGNYSHPSRTSGRVGRMCWWDVSAMAAMAGWRHSVLSSTREWLLISSSLSIWWTHYYHCDGHCYYSDYDCYILLLFPWKWMKYGAAGPRLMFSNWGARCWKPQDDSNSDEWTLTCRSMSSENSLTQVGPNSRKMCLKMLKKAWFIHDKDVDLTDSICTCKTTKDRKFRTWRDDSDASIHPLPIGTVTSDTAQSLGGRFETQAHVARGKESGFQKASCYHLQMQMSEYCSPMICVWFCACPLKTKKWTCSGKIIVIRLVPSHGEKIPQPRKTCMASRRHQSCMFATADLHPSCSALLSGGRVVAGLQCYVTMYL